MVLRPGVECGDADCEGQRVAGKGQFAVFGPNLGLK